MYGTWCGTVHMGRKSTACMAHHVFMLYSMWTTLFQLLFQLVLYACSKQQSKQGLVVNRCPCMCFCLNIKHAHVQRRGTGQGIGAQTQTPGSAAGHIGPTQHACSNCAATTCLRYAGCKKRGRRTGQRVDMRPAVSSPDPPRLHTAGQYRYAAGSVDAAAPRAQAF